MPVFSLPSKYGIGDFGSGAYNFIDNLKASGQKYWQVLPLVQTGLGNSPYSSVSGESISPYFISPEILVDKGLCTEEEISLSISDSKTVDYGFLYSVRFPLLKKAFKRFDTSNKAFQKFLKDKTDYDYALYTAIKEASKEKHFYEWEDKYKYRNKTALNKFAKEYESQILFCQFVQFEAKNEWLALKKYANKKGISIIGDMPLYLALDSVDVWTNPKAFKLNEDFTPKKVAGVPPDYFCSDGQLWGNPVYDYEYLEKTNFEFWIKRVKHALSIYDYVRIDHFRGLDRYYEIEPTATTAREGEWIDVPSEKLFNVLHNNVDKSRIIAEDLGIIDDGVRELLKFTEYPGMKVLCFAFNGESDNLYLPQNIEENYICYTGTHDNNTLIGLISSLNDWDMNNLVNGVKDSAEKLGVEFNSQDISETIIELGFSCKAKTFILPFSDLLKKGTEYRINLPGVVREENWAVRYTEQELKDADWEKLKELTDRYNR